jgi:glycosyltransferase involved in cell wall biosynthesis
VTKGNEKKSLLFISIDFPPARTSGIYRPVFFTKYLIDAGWDITLLTATEHLSTVHDQSLFDEIDPRLKIIRTSAPMVRKLTGKIYGRYKKSAGYNEGDKSKTSVRSRFIILLKKIILSPAFRLIDNFILIPDNYIIWSLKNIFRAYRIIKKEKITHLLVTSPPHSVQILGLILRFLTGVRYITDFRNSWTDNQPYKYRIRERFEKWVERKSLFRSRAVINMSPGDIDRLLARMPDISREKLFVVTNGFNEKEFTAIKETPGHNPEDPLRFIYVGSMYPHSGDSTAEALCLLAKKGYTEKDIVFSIIGFSDESFNELVDKYKIGHLVENLGFKDHAELMHLYPTFDVMHLVTGGTPYYHLGALPGKIFEYMRLGRPILHAGIDGTTHQILLKSGLEIFVPLDDTAGIAAAIIDLIERKKSSSLSMVPNREYADSFEWRRLARKVENILSAVK